MPITLIENFRAVFYAPFYAAMALGAYRAEGVEVDMQPSADPEKTLAQVTAGGGDVMWGGPLRLLYAHDRDAGSPSVAFCEVVGRDPFMVVGRTPKPDFRIPDLRGPRLAVVSEVPTPWICLRQDLRLAGVDLATLDLMPPRTMAENAALLRRGEIDAIQVFQPYARQLVDEGAGHVWYAAATRGHTSYTTLSTTRAFIERAPEEVLRMTRAMYRTLGWIARHDAATLARTIGSYFPDLPAATLERCVADYLRLGLWNTTPVQHRTGFEWLRDAMRASGDITRAVTWPECADMRFAEQAVREGVPRL